MKNTIRKVVVTMLVLSILFTSIMVAAPQKAEAAIASKFCGSWSGEYLTDTRLYERSLIIENQGEDGHIDGTIAELSFGLQMYTDLIARPYNFRKVSDKKYKASLYNKNGKKIKGATLTLTYINNKKLKVKVSKKIGGVAPKFINGIYTKY